MNEDLENAAVSLTMQIVRLRSLHLKGKPTPGIRPSEMFLLMHLSHWQHCQNGMGVKISELSEHMNVKVPTVTQSVNNLERMGIVYRSPDKKDRRLVRVCLTEQGVDLAAKNKQAFEEQIRAIASHLGTQKTMTLAHLLGDVFDYMSSREPNAETSSCKLMNHDLNDKPKS